MRRRNLIAGLVITTVSWSLAVHAQQPAIPVVGFLGVNSAGTQPWRGHANQKSLVLMNQDIRGVLIALIIIIVIFAAGMGGYYLR